MKISKITLTQGIGIGSLAILGYDALTIGTKIGEHKAIHEQTDYLSDTYVSHQSAPTESEVLEGARKSYKQILINDKFVPRVLQVKNMILSCIQKCLEYIIPISLSLGAIMFGGAKYSEAPITNILGKICLGGVIFSGVNTFMSHIVGKKSKD